MPIKTIEPITEDSIEVGDTLSPYQRVIQRFVERTNLGIDRLNQLIGFYDAEQDPVKKAEYLHVLRACHKKLNDTSSNRMIGFFPGFYKGVNETFMQDMLQEGQKDEPTSIEVSDVISNMAPNKLNKLAKIFATCGIDRIHEQLSVLYSEGEQGKALFDAFLTNYSISRLGGRGNSRSFVLSRIGASPAEKSVLKLENRMGRPRHQEVYLRRHGFSSVLTPIYAERQIHYHQSSLAYSIESDIKCRAIQVIEYCAGGDIESQASQYYFNFARVWLQMRCRKWVTPMCVRYKVV